MKKLLPAFIIGLSSPGFSQAYTPFPDSNAVWINTIIVPDENGVGYIQSSQAFCMTNQDTLIGSNSYSVVNYCSGTLSGMYYGAVRDTGGEVYIVPKDSANEFIMYDFTVTEGQVIEDVHFWVDNLSDVTIGEIDSMLIGGSYRTTIYLEEGAMWVEGVGSAWGFGSEPWTNVGNYAADLNCFTINDTVFWPDYNYGPGACAFNLGLDEVRNDAVIFPNPANDYITIISGDSQQPETISFSDISGKKLELSTEQNENQITADISSLPPGLYFITILTGQGEISTRIVKL